MTAKFDQKSEETVAENSYWVYKHDKYELPSGKEGDYHYVDINDFVNIVPITEENKLVAIKQYKYLFQEFSIEFPGGYCQEGKTPKESAEAELKEETGFKADKLTKIGSFNSSPGILKNTTHVFLANVSHQGKQDLDESEEIEVQKMSPTKLQKLIKKGEINHGETLGTWSLIAPILQKKIDSFNL